MRHGDFLELDRCPHCGVHRPTLEKRWRERLDSHDKKSFKDWGAYKCRTCGKAVLACAVFEYQYNKGRDEYLSGDIDGIWPHREELSNAIPERAREFLTQAIDSLSAPAGAVMLAASSVDAMLKAKGLSDGVLNSRIKQAAQDHLITDEMAEWAHEIRLEANAQRHADKAVPLPTQADAEKSIEFAKALAQFLFVLPARVAKGRTKNST